MLKLTAGATTPDTLPFTSVNSLGGLALDGDGAVYVTDTHKNRVLKLSAGSDAPTVLPFTGLNYPLGVAVDSAGNVYVADAKNGRVVKLLVV